MSAPVEVEVRFLQAYEDLSERMDKTMRLELIEGASQVLPVLSQAIEATQGGEPETIAMATLIQGQLQEVAENPELFSDGLILTLILAAGEVLKAVDSNFPGA